MNLHKRGIKVFFITLLVLMAFSSSVFALTEYVEEMVDQKIMSGYENGELGVDRNAL
ncbi:MAG: S-layer homology domain-containing protein [Tissierellia bacterium]|nr:S-layer homology domain-containing protein [Tissierellia bacterium]